ncbi:MAG: hypothetical protein K8U03_06020 [Planctomycetia bacterium]|nr:hypothetical protein [Planctomycetia bacterium]
MELLRLTAVHFGVAMAMSLGFVIAPIARRLFIEAADRVFKVRHRRSERWLMEVRTLEKTLTDERPPLRTYDPLRRGTQRPAPTR